MSSLLIIYARKFFKISAFMYKGKWKVIIFFMNLLLLFWNFFTF